MSECILSLFSCPIFESHETFIKHDDVIKWKETFSALLAICVGNSPVPGEFPAQRPVTRSFDVFFDLHPNKQLSKQWWGLWFETPSCPFGRLGNEWSQSGNRVLSPITCWALLTLEGENLTKIEYFFFQENVVEYAIRIYKRRLFCWGIDVPKFTMRTDVLPQDPVKSRDSGLEFSIHSEIIQSPLRQHRRDACQISECYDHNDIQSRRFETSWDLAINCLIAEWSRHMVGRSWTTLFRLLT